MEQNRYRDIAIVQVRKSDMLGYEPTVIPLAEEGDKVSFERLYSFGCAAGSWLTNFEGHAIDRNQSSGDVIHFVLMPAGGRSGSPIFDYRGEKIIGLIAWRSSSENHSQDGRTETDGHGIAMTYLEVQDWMKGRTSYGKEDVEIVRMSLARGKPLINPEVPFRAPLLFRQNQIDPSYCLLEDEPFYQERAYTLEYSITTEDMESISGVETQEWAPPFRRRNPNGPEQPPRQQGDPNDLFNNIDPPKGPRRFPDPQQPEQQPEEDKEPEQPETPNDEEQERAPPPFNPPPHKFPERPKLPELPQSPEKKDDTDKEPQQPDSEEESPDEETPEGDSTDDGVDDEAQSPWISQRDVVWLSIVAGLVVFFFVRHFIWNSLFFVLALTNENRMRALACSDE
jgi:hypothetical protein